jgi:hypothetical protein
VVVCGYCGRQYQVATPPTPLSPPVAPGSAPFPVASRNQNLGLYVGLVLTLMVAGAGASIGLFMQSAATAGAAGGAGARPGSPAGRTTQLSDAPRWWYSRGEPAITRGASEAGSLIGIVGRLNGNTDLTALDGAGGKVLWHVPAPHDSNVYANGDVILAYDAAKRVTRYDAATGKVRWTINVADYVHDITFGSGCASLRFGKPLGIDTETGNPKDCVPTRPALLGIEKGALHDAPMRRGDIDLLGAIQLDDKPLNPAPPRFALSASRAGHELWRSVPTTLEPVWTSDGFHRSVVLTPAGAFVYGRSSSDHHAHWLSLDITSGKTLYDSGGNAKVDDTVWMVAAGPNVYVNHDRRLEVYVAATGKLAWQVAEP